MSAAWFFSACLVVSLPWAWFLSATIPAAILLLVVAAWLVLRAALVKLWLALPDTRLAAGLTLRLSDAEAEVDTEACADGSLTTDVLSTTEAGAGALADSDGVELTDADAFALAEADTGADVD